MKKILTFVVVAVLMLSLPQINVLAAESADITVSDVTVNAGETAEVLINISNNPGLCALAFEIEYDAELLEVVSAQYTDLFGVSAQKVNISGKTVIFNIAKADNVTENGTVAKIVFRAKTRASVTTAVTPKLRGETGFVLHSAEDKSLHDVTLNLTAGSFTVIGDGTVTEPPVTTAPPCAHQNVVKTETKAASCTETGVASVSCADCGESLGEETLEKLEHAWGEWTVKTEPTAEKEGLEEQSCSVCGEINSRAVDKLAQTTTAALTTAPTEPDDEGGVSTSVILLVVAVIVIGALAVLAVKMLKKEREDREKDFM